MKAAVVAAARRYARAALKLDAARALVIAGVVNGISDESLVRAAVEYRAAARLLEQTVDRLDVSLHPLEEAAAA